MRTLGLIAACGLTLSACASLPPPVPVTAVRETVASASAPREPLGSPSLWPGGSADPDATGLVRDGFLVNTARTSALILHDFTGAELQRVPGARLTDIDVAPLPLAQSYAAIIGGTRSVGGRTRIALYRLDRGEGRLVEPWSEISTDLSEPRGFCMRQVLGGLRAVVIDRRGEVRHFDISEGPGGGAVTRETRRYRLMDSGEGCAIDPIADQVFFSRSRGGFWRAGVTSVTTGAPVPLIDPGSPRLPQTRGVSFLAQGRERYLVSLHSGSATASLWRVVGDRLDWVGRVEVRERTGERASRSLTGLEAYFARIGPYRNGVLVVQDQEDDGTARLKFLDWGEVRAALGL